MTEPETSPEIPYEQARDELIAVVQKLEVGGTSLEESLALWERGEVLAGICQQWLDGARRRLAAASGGAQDSDKT
jgi:exodeoxyribonuclease VII small subunit